jgi:hypothetical protein
MARSLKHRVQVLETATSADWTEVHRIRMEIFDAFMDGIIDEQERDRQFAMFPDASPPHIRAFHERLRAHPPSEAVAQAHRDAVARMTPEERRQDEAEYRARVERWEAEKQEAIARDPSKWGHAYAVLIPDWIKRRTMEVVKRAGLPPFAAD